MSAYDRVVFTPKNSVTFKANALPQTLTLYVRNESDKAMLYKTKYTSHGVFKTTPVFGEIPAGGTVTILLRYKGREGYEFRDDERFSCLLMESRGETERTTLRQSWSALEKTRHVHRKVIAIKFDMGHSTYVPNELHSPSAPSESNVELRTLYHN